MNCASDFGNKLGFFTSFKACLLNKNLEMEVALRYSIPVEWNLYNVWKELAVFTLGGSLIYFFSQWPNFIMFYPLIFLLISIL